MGWRTVEHMSGTSPVCTACGQAPRDDDNNFLPAYTADGVDVDWGNDLYICFKCAGIISGLHGCLNPEETEALEKRVQNLEDANEEKGTRLEEQAARIETILNGAKARKALKESVK